MGVYREQSRTHQCIVQKGQSGNNDDVRVQRSTRTRAERMREQIEKMKTELKFQDEENETIRAYTY